MNRRYREITAGPWHKGLVDGITEEFITPQAFINGLNIRVRADGGIQRRENNRYLIQEEYPNAGRPAVRGFVCGVGSGGTGSLYILDYRDENNIRINVYDADGNFQYATGQHTLFGQRASSLEGYNLLDGTKKTGATAAYNYAMRGVVVDTGAATYWGWKARSFEAPFGHYYKLWGSASGYTGSSPDTRSAPEFVNLYCLTACRAGSVDHSIYNHNASGVYALKRWRPEDASGTGALDSSTATILGGIYDDMASVSLLDGSGNWSEDVIFVVNASGMGYYEWPNGSPTSTIVDNTQSYRAIAVSRQTLNPGESCKVYMVVGSYGSTNVMHRYTLAWDGTSITYTKDTEEYDLFLYNDEVIRYWLDVQEGAGETSNPDGYLYLVADFGASGPHHSGTYIERATADDISPATTWVDIGITNRDVQRITTTQKSLGNEFADTVDVVLYGTEDGFYEDSPEITNTLAWIGNGATEHKRLIHGKDGVALLDGAYGAPMLLKSDGRENISINHAPQVNITHQVRIPDEPPNDGFYLIRKAVAQFVKVGADGEILKAGPYSDEFTLILEQQQGATYTYDCTQFYILVPGDIDPEVNGLRILIADFGESKGWNSSTGEYYTDAGFNDYITGEFYPAYLYWDGSSSQYFDGDNVVAIQPEEKYEFNFVNIDPYGAHADKWEIWPTCRANQGPDDPSGSPFWAPFGALQDAMNDFPVMAESVNGILPPRDPAPWNTLLCAWHGSRWWFAHGNDIWWSMPGEESYAFSAVDMGVSVGGDGNITELLGGLMWGLESTPTSALYIFKPGSIWLLWGSPGGFNPVGDDIEGALASWRSDVLGSLQMQEVVGTMGAPYPDAIAQTPYGAVFVNSDGVWLWRGGNQPEEISAPIRGLFQGGVHLEHQDKHVIVDEATGAWYFKDWNGEHVAIALKYDPGNGITPGNNNAALVFNFKRETPQWDGIYYQWGDPETEYFRVRCGYYHNGPPIFPTYDTWRGETFYGSSEHHEVGHFLSQFIRTVQAEYASSVILSTDFWAEFETPDLSPNTRIRNWWRTLQTFIDVSAVPTLAAVILKIMPQLGNIHGNEENWNILEIDTDNINAHAHYTDSGFNVGIGAWGRFMRLKTWITDIYNEDQHKHQPVILKYLKFLVYTPASGVEEPGIGGKHG